MQRFKPNIKILLLEDDADDAFVIQKLLTPIIWNASRFTIQTADCLEKGLAMLSLELPDIILTDLFLPDSKGSETVKSIWAHAQHMPIVVLTGHDDDDFAMEALQLGAQDYLVKGSFDGKMLARVIYYAIERAGTQAELARLASFPELSPVPIIEVDLTAEKITYANPAARLTFADLLSLGLLHPQLQGLRFVINRMQNENSQLHIRDLDLKNTVYEQQITFVPQSNAVRLYINDISQRRRLENLKDNFLNIISHELRTPVSIIKSSLESLGVLETGPLNDKQQKIVDIAANHTERLIRLINNLLEMSRLESGKAKINLRAVDLPTVLGNVLPTYEKDLASRGLTIVWNEATKLPSVLADEDLLTRVLMNLLDNAIRFAKKTLTITAFDRPDGRVQVSISDDGVGIAAADMPKLFNKFEQIQRPQQGSGYSGTGLGLAICQEIIKQHEGLIWAESVPALGATFHFTLGTAPSTK